MKKLKIASIFLSTSLILSLPVSVPYVNAMPRYGARKKHSGYTHKKHKPSYTHTATSVPSSIIKRMPFAKRIDYLMKISDSIGQGTIIDDFKKIPDLVAINNSFCKIFNFDCPEKGFFNFSKIDFSDFDFEETSVYSLGYGKLRDDITEAIVHTNQALTLFSIKNPDTTYQPPKIKMIKKLLHSISTALENILNPGKYYLGELSD